jgi:hypothetical protein
MGKNKNKKKKNAEVVFKYTDAVSNSNKSGKKKSIITLSAKTKPKETYTSISSPPFPSSISSPPFPSDTLQQLSILSLDTNEPINIDTKQVYVNYFINKNWNKLHNYLPFYEIELLEVDGESDYENDFCDY